MKTHGPVGPAIETELGTEADWQQFYSLLKSVKGIKRSSKPLFTSFKINKTEFHIIATLRLTRGHYEPIIRSIKVCSLFSPLFMRKEENPI